MTESQQYWNPAVEGLPLEELKRIQLQRLMTQIRYVYDNSPHFFRKKLEAVGAKPDDIRSWDDFRNLPICRTKEEDRVAQEESMAMFGHPYGTYLCAPLDQVKHVFCTSGTSGLPTFYTFTEADMRLNDESWARSWWRAGIRPGDTVLQGFGLSMWSAGVPVVRALANMGCRPIAAGAEGGVERMLMFANLTRPRALLGTPSLAELIIERCPGVLGKPASELGIEIIVAAGSPGAGIPGVRQKIEEGFGGAKIFDSSQGCWGLANVSCDSAEYHGLHVISEDNCIWYDIVDPETKKPVAIEDGAVGEGVITSFVHQAAPAFRYSFGDLLQVFTSPCPGCGFTGHRFKIIGRVDDMLNVRGIKVYPMGIKNVVATFIPRVTGDMRVVLDQPGPKVDPPLKVKIEHSEGLQGPALAVLKSDLEDRLRGLLKVRCDVMLVSPGSLERSTLKGKLVEKTYERN
ncbi:MAG: phenylacetate--CoA ligase family protein [Rhodospirillales bacterium]|nr:phenylacetate--CoA ligase family protein [Rhodospirillales bacterium]